MLQVCITLHFVKSSQDDFEEQRSEKGDDADYRMALQIYNTENRLRDRKSMRMYASPGPIDKVSLFLNHENCRIQSHKRRGYHFD